MAQEQIPGIPEKGFEPPFDFSGSALQQWQAQFLSVVKIPQKHRRPFLQVIEKYILPCLGTISRPVDSSDKGWKSGSRIGSLPMLPPDFIWPYTRESRRPLAFICQINLQETFGLPGLPESGMLTFFVDVFDSTNGWPLEKDRFAVYYFESIAELEERNLPESLAGNPNLNPRRLGFIPFYDFPDDRWADLLVLPKAESEALDWFLDEHHPVSQDRMKLLGYPRSVQAHPTLEAVLLRRYPGKWDAYIKHKSRIDEQAKEWILLMEAYAPYLGLSDFWGDAELYFLIRKDRLAALDFSAVQLIMQNT